MKWWWVLVFFLVAVLSAAGVWLLAGQHKTSEVASLISGSTPKPLEKYTTNNLSLREYKSQVFLDDLIATESAYTVFNFHFDSDGKKITGLAHVPNECLEDKCPVIVQFRGYVDIEIYKPGVGTSKSAEVFARNGYISLAPDFLGYGGSDNPAIDIFEARFETYVTALNLLSAIRNWSLSNGQAGIWGHSNGGQIALTVLEVSGQPIPTVLWAPVSKPFPYSILYYTDEADDKGKAIRKRLAEFEKDYDVFNYDLTRYLDLIVSPMQLHQGTVDDAVPQKWSDELVEQLKKQDKDIDYFVYPGADHNLKGSWDTVVARNVQFFAQHVPNSVVQ
ncbi:MAG: alpha/beta hydrolase [bacterium]|nr:alpha/beta hydrolase [bacterium]